MFFMTGFACDVTNEMSPAVRSWGVGGCMIVSTKVVVTQGQPAGRLSSKTNSSPACCVKRHIRDAKMEAVDAEGWLRVG